MLLVLLLVLSENFFQLVSEAVVLGEPLQALNLKALSLELLLSVLHGFGLHVEDWIVLDLLDPLGVLERVLGLHFVVIGW